jgi:hypothetical protein
MGIDQQPLQRSLTLLHAACPNLSLDELANLCIGERDSKLMALRGLTFGRRFAATTNCPGCGETVELNLNLDDFTKSDSLHTDEMLAQRDNEFLFFHDTGYDIRFRLPNSRDVVEGIENYSMNTDETCKSILRKCIMSLKKEGRDVPIDQLPDAVIRSIEHQMEMADPLSDIQLDLTCPTCSHEWQAHFDILTFFWGEIDTWAHHILTQVHLLASAYGWNESEILAMSPLRRQWYLELIYT